MKVTILQENKFKEIQLMRKQNGERYIYFVDTKNKNHLIKIKGKSTNYFIFQNIRYDVIIGEV